MHVISLGKLGIQHFEFIISIYGSRQWDNPCLSTCYFGPTKLVIFILKLNVKNCYTEAKSQKRSPVSGWLSVTSCSWFLITEALFEIFV